MRTLFIFSFAFIMKPIHSRYNLITILGPTATGKTGFAANLAVKISGEIISADSRQVYRNMDIGTGKDYDDYIVEGKSVPVHLIDMEEPGAHYNVYRFQSDFIKTFNNLQSEGKFPLLCGGTGLYLEAVLKDYKLIHVPPDRELRKSLEGKSLEELAAILKSIKSDLHNITDIETDRRAIRAIEIEMFYRKNPSASSDMPVIKSLNIGVIFDRHTRRQRISERLKQRLSEGMIEEVRGLLNNGLTPDQLIYYGLEYKYITLYLTGILTYQEMYERLEIAIHQFAKRQMTYFRGMEKRGTDIHWIDGHLPVEKKVDKVLSLMASH